MSHGKLSPSKAHRWLVCPGSQFFEADGAESSYAEDGQLGHDILERVLKGQPVLTGDDINGRPAPEHRIQQAIEIRDYIAQWKTQHPDFVTESESPIRVAEGLGYSNRPEDFDGTADLVAWNAQEAVILDAKFGFVRVEPQDNAQLYLYAFGLLNELERMFDSHPVLVTVIIAQPDYEGLVQFREHRMTAGQLWSWHEKQYNAIKRAADGDKTLNPASEQACRYCPGRATCQPRHEVLMKFAQEEWRMTKTLGELLPLLPQIRHIADDLEAEAKRQLAADMTVPGFKLVESRSIRKWSDSREFKESAHERDRAGILLFKTKMKSPAEIEKEYKAEGKAFTKKYAVTPRGQPKLAPDSDPRPSYKPENFTQEQIDEMLEEE